MSTDPTAGQGGSVGTAGAGGVGAIGGAGGTSSIDAGAPEDAGSGAVDGETGALVGITAAHNAARAMVDAVPALGDLEWSNELALVAQDWAEQLASDCTQSIPHRPSNQYGENIAAYFGFGGGLLGDPQQVVDGWYNEVACWTYGTIHGTEQCNMQCAAEMFSNGCGHYTQVVWRDTMRVGCGVATCTSGSNTNEYWVCNYDPPGNWVGETPY